MYSIDMIRHLHQTNGGHWFDAGAMRFFNTRVHSTVYRGDDVTSFFVSSERYDENSPRLFSVRRAVRTESGVSIETVGAFQGYASRGEAHRAALREAYVVKGLVAR